MSESAKSSDLQRGDDARFEAVLASVLDPTITIDAFGTIQHASDSVVRTFGYSPEELIGQNLKVLMPEPHHSKHDDYLAHYRATGETNIIGRTREFEILHKDGSKRTCDLSVARAELPGADGPLFVGSFRDMTDKRKAERALRESERRFRAIFDNEYEYVGLLDTRGRILEMNRAALASVGESLQNVVGRPFWDSPWWPTDSDHSRRVKEAIAVAADGGFVRFEATMAGRDGHIMTVDFSLKPVENDEGEVILLLPEGRNITESKRAQEAERRMLRTLAHMGESAAAMAHEIKNPITAVNVALRAVAKELGEDHQVVLQDLSSRMARLEKTMRRTLSFATPLQIQAEPCSSDEILASAIEQVGPHAAETEITIESQAPDGDLSFQGSPAYLEEVLYNLAHNAVDALDAHDKKGRIVLSARLCAGQSLCFMVEDDGPGIPPHIKDSLFRPFVTSKKTGTGLGLAICEKIVEAHGGTITVEDAVPRGTVFKIELPLGSEQPNA